MTSASVFVELTLDEALVLYEFLHRYTESDQLDIADQAEQRALWNLLAVLEKILVEPFDARYVELVTAARERLRDQA